MSNQNRITWSGIVAAAALLSGTWVAQAPASMLPVTSGLVLHLNANDPLDNGGGTLPGSGTKVATWFDTSASGFDATQATVNRQPTFQPNANGAGKHALRFDGSATPDLGDYLSLGTAVGKLANSTIFVVAMKTSLATSGFALGSTSSDGAGVNAWASFGSRSSAAGKLEYFFSDSVITPGSDYSRGTTTNVVLANNTFALMAETYASGDTLPNIYINGGASQSITTIDTGDTANNGTAYEMSIGRFGAYNPAGFYWGGDISQVVIYNRVLTTQERADVSSYLMLLPEPASLTLLALGGAMVLGRKRRAGGR